MANQNTGRAWSCFFSQESFDSVLRVKTWRAWSWSLCFLYSKLVSHNDDKYLSSDIKELMSTASLQTSKAVLIPSSPSSSLNYVISFPNAYHLLSFWKLLYRSQKQIRCFRNSEKLRKPDGSHSVAFPHNGFDGKRVRLKWRQRFVFLQCFRWLTHASSSPLRFRKRFCIEICWFSVPGFSYNKICSVTVHSRYTLQDKESLHWPFYTGFQFLVCRIIKFIP